MTSSFRRPTKSASTTTPCATASRCPASRSRRRTSTSSHACSPISESMRASRSEEHTSELQSRQYLVCRLLLEKKKKDENTHSKLYIHSGSAVKETIAP